jgi:hypothetical protein
MMTVAAVQSPPIPSVPRLWPNETCVILGGGPSLTQADCDYVRGKAHVIAIKEAGHCSLPGRTAPAPWADILYAADEKFWRFEKGAPGFGGLKYSIHDDPRTTREQPDARLLWADIQILRNTGELGLELDPTGLRTGYNSGYQAIGIAVHLGVTRIILLGFDMWAGADGLRNWFGHHPTHVPSPYPVFLHAFASLEAPLRAAGVQVVNCSRQTMLRTFPRVALEDALP